MQKKFAIAFCVIAALWIAFLTYRHLKNKDEDKSFTEESYNQMTEFAKKSPKAGLTRMGMAIKNYYRDNGKYPPSLTELHPDYIQDKNFIEDIKWQYTPSKDNFRLAKTVEVKGQLRTAYVTSDLYPREQGGETRVASRTSGRSGSSSKTTGTRADSASYVPPEATTRELSKEELQKMKSELLAQLHAGGATVATDTLPDTEETTIPYPLYTPIGDAHEVKNISDFALAWKSPTGALGFGNVNYPEPDQNRIYHDGKWFRMAHSQEEEAGTEGAQNLAVNTSQRPDIPAKFNQKHLVWKDPTGAIGFGNIMYPDSSRYMIYQKGQWIDVADNQVAEETMDVSKANVFTDREGVLLRQADTFFTWKATGGALGFGNIMDPSSSLTAVYTNGRWIATNQNSLPSSSPDAGTIDPSPNHMPKEQLTEKYGQKNLTWRDKNGVIGFGNVNYPEEKNISVYGGNGTWHETD
ncbi:MAG: hypothetical protein SWH61_08815 [Thermodesulfobacteriota bacterium]|nr:hypothetical protein [Thermodesulfobacteriota bacterium]